MLRFIFNFILFGVLFYLIWFFFPDAFAKLVEWAGDIVNFIVHWSQVIVEKIRGSMASS